MTPAEIISGIVILIGAFFILVASIGLIRFRDLYSRMHATTKATSFGILLVLLGTAFIFNVGVIWFKSFLVIVFIYLTAPLAAHSIARANKEQEENSEK